MQRIKNRTLGCASLALVGMLGLAGCGEGGALGELDRLGREDYSPSSSSDSAESGSSTIEATVSRVVDGDTIAVEPTGDLPANSSGGREHSVRVLGIDAPEMDWNGGDHECGAQEATDRAAQMFGEGDAVTLVYDDEADRFDRYDRSLAYVEDAGQQDLGAVLVAEGLVAAWYPSSAPEPGNYASYSQMMEEAQENSVGSWGHCTQMGR